MEKSPIRVLVVDDEESITSFIRMGLKAKGYEVETASDGLSGVLRAKSFAPHVVVLDVMMPGMDGLEACREIKRALGVSVSVILLTARGEVEDRILGLETGADDYMGKPFSFVELLARIQARVRQMCPDQADVIATGDFRMDDGAHEIRYKGELLGLTPTEYNLLRHLLLNRGRVQSKDMLLEKVWGYDFDGEANVVEVYVRQIRDKIGDVSRTVIQTVRGFGYKVAP